MSLVILQPSADRASAENYVRTVLMGIDTTKLTKLSLGERHALETFSVDGRVRLWGAKPAEDGRNIKRWKKISPGDYLFFVRGNDQMAYCQVLDTFHNQAQARELWGTTLTKNGAEQTWEYIMVLGAAVEGSIPKERLNELIGRKANANVQEFVVLNQAKSHSLIDALGMGESTANPQVEHPETDEGRALTPKPDDSGDLEELDAVVQTKRRLEQQILRKYLLPGNSGRCALCGRVFPIGFLVAAHIKPRSACSPSEKRDFANIAMPNCKLGCDELWGRGLITLDESGKVRHSPEAPDAGPVALYLATHLSEGSELEFFEEHPKARSYFDYHREHEFKRSLDLENLYELEPVII